ncbi:5-demethoxyubiquinol-8 5-hydroxylase UbiM [Pigmentiphaga aceris]|uniref:5-demethoxyubiquinol-8 5-hydroxylase UbiM n=1 Tax=Pigmentiphaga aceris TaxID=1940612 RepID=A0A5C0AVP3_9BURK|nr:5-demethoxyubiquinol-8 5-hydroxylase UbiM [Pigmentiphaga aceris]QEI04731.1 5-demethoxyubiquinol-8 5-hydroxylase UbiM [Pigmentiphaga aceris]
MNVDVAIVGAGPTGLCLARSLANSGLSLLLIDKQPHDAIADPAFDGREIALTHASQDILARLGIWQRIDADEISPLRHAQVMNGSNLPGMKIVPVGSDPTLGALVPNHLIRRAAYAAIQDQPGVALRTGVGLSSLRVENSGVTLALSDGERVDARLIIAADSRFSETRRMLGIGAQMRDFGKSMMVCRMAHELPHEHTAWEWFDYGQTLALLPLNGNRSSVVLTLPPRDMQQVMQLEDGDFEREIQRRFQGRLGGMKVAGTRHVYPLVGTYAQRMVGPRAALIGDAAVGMHPVTAHGFNFGLQSQQRLADALLNAVRLGADIADPGLLKRYERGHRLATHPLYLATNLVASLYTDDSPPARLLRAAALQVADRLAPFKRALAAQLSHTVTSGGR